MRYMVSGLFIVVGIALLLLPNTFMIRWTNISWGWLALGLGVPREMTLPRNHERS